MKAKLLFLAIAVASIIGWNLTGPKEAKSLPSVVTYKDPLCGCCQKWIDHMRSYGFSVTVIETSNHFNVPQALRSCHTSTIGDRIIEGHVPADYIERWLAGNPSERGLAVPGMPLNSPGMENQKRADAYYEIYSFTDRGEVKVYAPVYRVEQ